ncbi:hypothetical protein [Parafrankia sp. BMG5.11]|uniref:hypothetical protein n=1 Tax=Parafrankia sp. BMG5.11 TaxID=222540 RepID=UPI000DA520F2|nr:hypothetical protein [Parafrankia sp. BMG5.11]SQD94449.1 hypothetical protein FMEAI12_2570002 [Parafrankia sp. Ea1.12]
MTGLSRPGSPSDSPTGNPGSNPGGSPASLAGGGSGWQVHLAFDNTGGARLEAAIEVMNPHGRIALCGALPAKNGGTAQNGGTGAAGAVEPDPGHR